MINLNFLQILLLGVLLSAGTTRVSAQVVCDQEELCEAQARVTEIVEQIVEQYDFIESHWQALDSTSAQFAPARWYERTQCVLDMVNRYLRIGTLESRLLVAYSKLSSIELAMSTKNPRCYCNDDIQLSAGF